MTWGGGGASGHAGLGLLSEAQPPTQSESDCRLQEANFAAAVEALPFEPKAMKRRCTNQFGHGVSELNFTASPFLHSIQMLEDLRL